MDKHTVDVTLTCSDPRDQVEHPSHYTYSGIEVWDAITAWGLAFCEGNVVKYVARASYHAAGRLTNLYKARQYLDKAIEVEEARCAHLQHTCEECDHWSMASLKCTCEDSADYNQPRKREDTACAHLKLSNR